MIPRLMIVGLVAFVSPSPAAPPTRRSKQDTAWWFPSRLTRAKSASQS